MAAELKPAVPVQSPEPQSNIIPFWSIKMPGYLENDRALVRMSVERVKNPDAPFLNKLDRLAVNAEADKTRLNGKVRLVAGLIASEHEDLMDRLDPGAKTQAEEHLAKLVRYRASQRHGFVGSLIRHKRISPEHVHEDGTLDTAALSKTEYFKLNPHLLSVLDGRELSEKSRQRLAASQRPGSAEKTSEPAWELEEPTKPNSNRWKIRNGMFRIMPKAAAAAIFAGVLMHGPDLLGYETNKVEAAGKNDNGKGGQPKQGEKKQATQPQLKANDGKAQQQAKEQQEARNKQAAQAKQAEQAKAAQQQRAKEEQVKNQKAAEAQARAKQQEQANQAAQAKAQAEARQKAEANAKAQAEQKKTQEQARIKAENDARAQQAAKAKAEEHARIQAQAKAAQEQRAKEEQTKNQKAAEANAKEQQHLQAKQAAQAKAAEQQRAKEAQALKQKAEESQAIAQQERARSEARARAHQQEEARHAAQIKSQAEARQKQAESREKVAAAQHLLHTPKDSDHKNGHQEIKHEEKQPQLVKMDHPGGDKQELKIYPDRTDHHDSDHPSGKDRNEEHGKSYPQGHSGSNPDGNGVDKPYNADGKQAKSQGRKDFDGNNGCGNDHDFADDNNGNCGGKHLEHKDKDHEDHKDKDHEHEHKDKDHDFGNKDHGHEHKDQDKDRDHKDHDKDKEHEHGHKDHGDKKDDYFRKPSRGQIIFTSVQNTETNVQTIVRDEFDNTTHITQAHNEGDVDIHIKNEGDKITIEGDRIEVIQESPDIELVAQPMVHIIEAPTPHITLEVPAPNIEITQPPVKIDLEEATHIQTEITLREVPEIREEEGEVEVVVTRQQLPPQILLPPDIGGAPPPREMIAPQAKIPTRLPNTGFADKLAGVKEMALAGLALIGAGLAHMNRRRLQDALNGIRRRF
jgi:hypothetical protein